MTDTATDALLAKIRKLRAKAEDPSVTEAEATLFAAKVAALLAEHGLSEAALHLPDEDPITNHRWDVRFSDPWRRTICRCAARLYFCGLFVHSWHEKNPKHATDPRAPMFKFYNGLTFVARAHNATVAREMSDYLIRTTLRLGYAYSETRAEQLAFMRGCGERLGQRLYYLWDEQTRAAKQRGPSGNPQNLPALYADEEALYRAAMEKEDLRPFGRGSDLNSEHADAGAAAADGVSLAPQVPGAATAATRLK